MLLGKYLNNDLMNYMDREYGFISYFSFQEPHLGYYLKIDSRFNSLIKKISVHKCINTIYLHDALNYSKEEFFIELYFKCIKELWFEEKILKARLMNLWG